MMADALNSADQQIQAQKVALLQAVAQGGTAGRQQYEDAQSQVKAQQQQAVSDALAAAQKRGAPIDAAGAGITSKINAPYDRRLLDLSSSAASRQASFDAASQANSNYLDEERSAVPALRAITERKIAELRALAEEKAAQRQAAAEDRAFRLQFQQGQLDAQQAKAAKAPSLSSQVADAGGADFLGQKLAELSAPSSSQSKYAETEHTLYGAPNDPQGTELAALGRQLGLPEGYAKNLVTTSATKAVASTAKADAIANPDDAALAKKAGMSGPKSVQQTRTSPEYLMAVEYAKTGSSAGYTLNDLRDKLNQVLPGNPKVARLILAEYGSLYHN